MSAKEKERQLNEDLRKKFEYDDFTDKEAREGTGGEVGGSPFFVIWSQSYEEAEKSDFNNS